MQNHKFTLHLASEMLCYHIKFDGSRLNSLRNENYKESFKINVYFLIFKSEKITNFFPYLFIFKILKIQHFHVTALILVTKHNLPKLIGIKCNVNNLV